MAYCANCGQEVSPQAPSCPNCGHPQQGAGAPVAYVARRTEGTATAALILGIAGLIICPLVCSVLAIVFGNQAKNKIAADPSLEGEGMAKAGVILGWIGVALTVLWVILFAVVIGSDSTFTDF